MDKDILNEVIEAEKEIQHCIERRTGETADLARSGEAGSV